MAQLITVDELARRDPGLKRLVDETQQLMSLGMWEVAVPKLRDLIAQEYNLPLTYQALGTGLMTLHQVDAGIAAWHHALQLDPTLASVHENLVMLIDAHPDTTPAAAKAIRDQWWHTFGRTPYAGRPKDYANVPDPDRSLRIGYVSMDFKFHSSNIAYSPVVMHHSPDMTAVFYSTLLPQHYDQITAQYISLLGPAWVDVHQYRPRDLAQIIHDDQIDLLVDLSGYTAGNRLETFAYQPAPIQITAWGYATGLGWPAETGLVLLADPFVCPPALRATMPEQVIDLPSVITYTPRADVPPINPLPCLTAAHGPVFAVFQRGMKLNPAVLAVYTAILKRVPSARILFKGPDYPPSVQALIKAAMAPVVDQLLFRYNTGHLEHLLWYQECDLGLDPWPQTGGVSTLEGLDMGVPCVTLLGDRVIQRTSASFFTTLGIPEFIATTEAEYIEKAVAFVTTRRDELAAIRPTLRERLRTSPILVGYREKVENIYRTLWRNWCAAQRKAA